MALHPEYHLFGGEPGLRDLCRPAAGHAARVLCQESYVLALDEPASFLDIRHKIEPLDMLFEEARFPPSRSDAPREKAQEGPIGMSGSVE